MSIKYRNKKTTGSLENIIDLGENNATVCPVFKESKKEYTL